MATITDYSSLQSAIADYLNREDLSAQIPMFIQFVESDLNTRLRTRDMVVRAQATSSNEFVQLPGDWLEAINLHIIDGQQPLEYVTADRADIIKKRQIYTSPHNYSIMDGAIEIVPAPSDDIEIEMIYYSQIPSLSDSNTTNWLLSKSPDVYLYGALSHAAPFLLDDQRMPMFAQIYIARTQSMIDESEKAMHSGSPLIARPKGMYYGRFV